MIFEDLKNALSEAILDLKPAKIPVEYEMVTPDRSETDTMATRLLSLSNSNWTRSVMR